MIVTPFGDTQAHGAFGKSVILERRRGIVYAKSFRAPKNPRSILQKIQRQKFTTAIAGWQLLTPTEQDYFNQLATGKTYTGFNLYVSRQLLETPPSTTPFLLTDILDAHITTTRSDFPNGWTIQFFCPSPHIVFGIVEDNSNVFTDYATYPTPIFLKFVVPSEEQDPKILAGDSVRITYDAGEILYIFLPAITEEFDLFPADDGSTYYDQAMTNLAQAAP